VKRRSDLVEKTEPMPVSYEEAFIPMPYGMSMWLIGATCACPDGPCHCGLTLE
jgi:hypothetical protein